VTYNMLSPCMEYRILCNLHALLILSQDIGVGINYKNPSSPIKLFNHVATLLPSVKALYSTLVEDIATVDCHLQFHDRSVKPRLNK
jgi:hypothetical protein